MEKISNDWILQECGVEEKCLTGMKGIYLDVLVMLREGMDDGI